MYFAMTTRMQMAMLVPLLAVIAVIQVLPQVDLPETAFHEDTAPIVMKSRAGEAPTFVVVIQRSVHGTFQSTPLIVADAPGGGGDPHNSSPLFLYSPLLC